MPSVRPPRLSPNVEVVTLRDHARRLGLNAITGVIMQPDLRGRRSGHLAHQEGAVHRGTGSSMLMKLDTML